MLYEAILIHHSIPQTSARRPLWVVFVQHIATGVLLCCSGHLACLVRQRHWRAQVVAAVVIDDDALLLFSFFSLQLHLHILHECAWHIGTASPRRAKVSAATILGVVRAYFSAT